jgi:hypothetical protein
VVKEMGDSLLNASSSTHNLPGIGLPAVAPLMGAGAAVTDVERATWQQEKQKLYQQLDDKVLTFFVSLR